MVQPVDVELDELKTGHLMTSFAEEFYKGFAEELKNDNPQRT